MAVLVPSASLMYLAACRLSTATPLRPSPERMQKMFSPLGGSSVRASSTLHSSSQRRMHAKFWHASWLAGYAQHLTRTWRVGGWVAPRLLCARSPEARPSWCETSMGLCYASCHLPCKPFSAQAATWPGAGSDSESPPRHMADHRDHWQSESWPGRDSESY